jgi:lipopolysaccharide biosynthesis glycosyltransferase
MAQAFSNYPEMAVSPHAKYFNSGVLLMDLERWRSEGITEEVLAHAKRYRRHLRFPDQDALNSVLATRWLELEPRWNSVLNVVWGLRRGATPRARRAYDAVLERPAILHFLAGPKPWQPGAFFHRRFLFFHYLDRTKWAGWRPSVTGRRAHRLRSSRAR